MMLIIHNTVVNMIRSKLPLRGVLLFIITKIQKGNNYTQVHIVYTNLCVELVLVELEQYKYHDQVYNNASFHIRSDVGRSSGVNNLQQFSGIFSDHSSPNQLTVTLSVF